MQSCVLHAIELRPGKSSVLNRTNDDPRRSNSNISQSAVLSARFVTTRTGPSFALLAGIAVEQPGHAVPSDALIEPRLIRGLSRKPRDRLLSRVQKLHRWVRSIDSFGRNRC